MPVPFVVSNGSISLMIKGQMYPVPKDHQKYEEIKAVLRTATEEELLHLVSFRHVVKSIYGKNVTFKDGFAYTDDGNIVSSAMTDRYSEMVKEGLPTEGIEKFIQFVYQNPSQESVKDLYTFLEACNLPITDDGCFVAYKKIRGDWKDCHTASIDNSIGAIVEMPREKVDPNRNQTCSSGLHVCSESYLQQFSGERVVLVKVNPRDVVSVPVDYDNAKMRVCRYEVVSELNEKKIPSQAEFHKTQDEFKASPQKSFDGLGARNKVQRYAEERNIPIEFASEMEASAKKNFFRSVERSLYGKHAASNKEIRACKTLTELFDVVEKLASK